MRALIHAFRTWRADRRDLDETDRLIAGARAGTGLDHLLGAVRAPATTGELSGEQAMAAAVAAERRRAAAPAHSIRVRTSRAG
ncbi:hypothetical protein [Actinoplanes sp. GCM10030250]|uniref:hypothetical protein n=1 Tax=Actinoplanes sp. GCM10030250 TaxID=3273376 RepID=UPI003622FCF0